MKYKVGDKVRIKSIEWYNENKDITGWVGRFNRYMSRYCGKEAIIMRNPSCYTIDIDGGYFGWEEDMFED